MLSLKFEYMWHILYISLRALGVSEELYITDWELKSRKVLNKINIYREGVMETEIEKHPSVLQPTGPWSF